mgnify:CR=1 FL=1|jgi:hypothetical protein
MKKTMVRILGANAYPPVESDLTSCLYSKNKIFRPSFIHRTTPLHTFRNTPLRVFLLVALAGLPLQMATALEITDETVGGNRYGTYVSKPDYTHNADTVVTMTGGDLDYLMGFWSGASNVSVSDTNNTTVTVTGGEATRVYGAYAGSTATAMTANNTTVTVSSGTQTNVYGVYSQASSNDQQLSAKNTKVTLSGNKLDSLYGVISFYEKVDADSTQVIVNNEGTVTGSLYAVYSGNIAKTNDASVTLENSSVDGNVFGLRSNADVIAEDTEVTITNSKVLNYDVVGVHSSAGVTATGTALNVRDNSQVYALLGVESGTVMDAKNTAVTVADSSFQVGVRGLYTLGGGSADATTITAKNIKANYVTAVDSLGAGQYTNTKLTIEESEITKSVSGVFINPPHPHNDDESVTVNNTVVKATNLKTDRLIGVEVLHKHEIIDTLVEVNGGEVEQVYGAISGVNDDRETLSGTVQNTTVRLLDGNLAQVYGADLVNRTVGENTIVDVQGGTIGEVHGAEVAQGSATATKVLMTAGTAKTIIGANIKDTGSASNTEVNITGGNVSGTVTGVTLQSTGSVSDTDVTVSGNHPDLQEVYGVKGAVSGAKPQDTVVTLSNLTAENAVVGVVSIPEHVATDINDPHADKIVAQGVNKVKEVTDFSALELRVSEANRGTSGESVLTTAESIDLKDKRIVIDTAESSEGLLLESGFKLLDVTGEGSAILANEGTVIEAHSIFLEAEGTIRDSWLSGDAQKQLYVGDFKVTHQVTPATETLGQAFVGSVAFLNQGAEFVADEALNAIDEAATAESITGFAVMNTGASQYETGSYVDVNGVTVAAGAATRIDNVTVAGFVEVGWAESEGHAGASRGDGDHDYFGVGAAARWNISESLYADASLRAGRMSTDFKGWYIQGTASYEADTFYASAHLGLGKTFKLNDKVKADVYGRYVLTYLEGSKENLHTETGERFDMDNTVSHAVRAGVRFTGSIQDNAHWRLGAAYERTFDGKAKSDIVAGGIRASLDTPALRGNTAIFEAGLKLQPKASSPWSVNVGAKGYLGDREGLSGSVTGTYRF